MRRFHLVWVALIAAALALPASARTFRVEGSDCSDQTSIFYFCWGGTLPNVGEVALPTDNDTSPFTPNPPTGEENPSLNPAVFTHNDFVFTAFDYLGFLAANSLDPNDFDAPNTVVTRGVGRVNSSPGQPFNDGDAPLLRINWNLDSDLLELFRDVIFDIDNFNGVQMIFYGNGTNSFPTVAPGSGFELNGLKSYEYSSSTLDDEPLWIGAREPCGTFDNSGACITAVPEPSSVALLGLGVLALVIGLRTGRRARTQFA